MVLPVILTAAGALLRAGAVRAAPYLAKVLKPTATKTITALKSPLGVGVGTVVAGAVSPSVGREGLGIALAYGIGGIPAAGITAGLSVYTKAKDYVASETIKTPESFKSSMSVIDAARYLGFADPYDYGGLSGDDVIRRAKAAGWSEPVVVEASPVPVTGVAPEISAGLSGLLPTTLSNAILPAILGGAAGAGITYYATRKKATKKKATKKKATKKKATKKKATRKKATRKVGTAKQYRRAGGKSVKYTKNGQPYIILNSGKARFIKK